MEQLLTDSTHISEMPNQDEFKNLIVEPSDIRHQSCAWEASKKIKVLAKQTSKPQSGDCSEKDSWHESEFKLAPGADSSPMDKSDSLDDECEIITFIIGATSLRDTSKPMPPPSRFVRRGDSQ